MNKNLKKVISAVAALAVSASSIVAFAAGYPDVAETASYAQAVSELSALGVINGYDDGTFAPDKNVTRAEITKMIVTALGSSSMSAAEAATGKDTQFDDVKGTHWASGYVTVGTSSGSKFIDGYSDTEFGPEDNVTYAQAIKMLVGALGYTTYAENNGGWPNGYLSYGYSLDITKGITGVSNDTQVTRAQVAQMIDNAIKAPICVIDGYDTQWNGVQTPKLVEKNQTSMYNKDTWQCLLNYSHDAYVVNGRVKATHQSSQATLKADEVNISIEKSNNYEGYQVAGGESQGTNVGIKKAYIGESGADKYLFTYAEMIIQMDEDDELTILSIVPVGSNRTATFKTEDFAEDKTDLTASNGKGTIYAYSNGSSTKTDSYRIDTTKINGATEGGFYVNGVQVTGDLADNLSAYVENNTTGEVTLIDSPETGTSSTDNIYDYIMVTYYKDAVVDSVSGSDTDYTVSFTESQAGMRRLLVDYEDDQMYYSFRMADGTEIKPSDLQENDVLSIAYDVNVGFADSKSYDVIVSRDTVEGKVTSVNPDADKPIETEYTISGQTYKRAAEDISDDLTTGSTYTLYLDAFGRYAKMEETAASKKIALVDNVYEANGGQYYVTIVTPEGSKVNYTVKDEATYNTYKEYCFKTSNGTVLSGNENKLPLKDRVYSYSLSSSTGNITLKAKEKAKEVDGTYKADSNKIGSLRMNDSITSMLDMSEYYNDPETETGYVGTINSMTSAALEDDADYKAYGFNQISDNSYQFVLVMNATGVYTYNTEFYVFSKTSTEEVDGEDKTTIYAYKDGEEVEKIVLEEDNIGEEDLTEGDPIVIKTNSSGYATEILPLFAADALSNGYKSFSAAVRANLGLTTGNTVLNVTNLNKALKHNTGDKNESDWVFGIVTDKSDRGITVADKYDTVTDVKDYYGNAVSSTHITNVEELDEISYDTDVKFIVYDYDVRSGKQLRVSASQNKGSVVAPSFSNSVYVSGTWNSTEYTAKDKALIDWDSSLLTADDTAQYGEYTFALVKTVDGDATEVYVIVPSATRK